MWLQSASTPTPTNAHAPYWNGWAREEKRVAIGSPQEAALQKELDAISRALDTFDSKVLARFGGHEGRAALPGVEGYSGTARAS